MSANVVKVSGDYKIKAASGGAITFDAGNTGNVSIIGNLTVTGGTTSITTTNTNITDNIIFLNKGEIGHSVSLTVAGIEIDRGDNGVRNAQFYFDESLQWAHPNGSTPTGLFVFKTANNGINGIRTNSINTNGGNLNLINQGNGVISVSGTNNYEDHVTDDDHIPNKKYVIDHINAAVTGGGNLILTQPTHTATLTIADYKTFTVSNTLTLTGTDSSSINFGAGGTVAYTSNTLYVGTTSIALNRASATQTLSGVSIDGNAGTATKLSSARTINGTSFDGSSNITITVSAGDLTGNILASGVTSSSLTSVGTLASLTVTNTITGSVSGNSGTVTNGVYTSESYSDPGWIASLAYSKLTGAPTDHITLISLSIDTKGTPNGNGDLEYSQTTGKFKYTPPDLSPYLTASSTATLTNKTFDTAGLGNVLRINGTQISNITGTGKVVLDINPTLIAPALGNATATTINKVTITVPAAGSTLTIADGKTATVNSTLTFSGSDGSSIAFGIGGTVAYSRNKLNSFASTSSAELAGVISDETGTGSLVFATSPTLIAPALGNATATTINKVTITVPAAGSTLTIADGKTLTASNTLTFTGTDASSVNFSDGGTVTYTKNKLNVFSSTTSAELAGVISDETGTGALVFATSPTLSTSVVTDSSSFNLINTIATTVNFAGAATTTNISDSGNINLGSSTSATTTVKVGGAISGNTLKVASTNSGTIGISSDVTTGTINLFTGTTTGTINVGSAAAGTASVKFTTESTSTSIGALVVAGGVGIEKNLNVGGLTTMVYQTTNPTDSDGVTVYAKEADLGNTGLYYVNSSGTTGELVSKKKALAYSIVFG